MSPRCPAADLEGKIDADLAHRTFQGTWGHPVTLLLVFFTTNIAADYPKQFWIAAALLVLMVLLRIPLLVGHKTRTGLARRRWRLAMMIDILSSAALWGTTCALTCAFYGCQSRNATLLILYITAVASAGVHLLVQSVTTVVGYLALLMGPLVLVACSQGQQGMWLAAAVVFYYVYLVSQARRLRRQYWQQLQDNEELRTRAHRDSLTGLHNRLALREVLTATIADARDSGSPVPLLYIDLDGFKQINDHFSHRVGDLFLCEIANRLRVCCEPGGTPFRLGGDEFTILLPSGTTAEAASQFAIQLLARVKEPILIDSDLLTASASVGLSIFPDDCQDEEGLLRTADHAMYWAKASGKGTHEIFRDARRSSRFLPNALARDMRDALEHARFDVHYQPQVNHRGELAGFEALLRWTHPEWGNIPPLEFIPLAEETGLLVPLGLWILRRVCQQGNAWSAEGYAPVPLSVNVSPIQLDKPDFVENLLAILRETGFPPEMLTLEITESTLLSTPDSALAQLQRIRSLGVKIAIDDFGTGHSSLSRIHKLPIDVLKLDRTFTAAIQSTGDRAPIVEAVLAMARSLGVAVVAEGIEVPGQFEALSRMGCRLFQGYYFGRPSGAEVARQCCAKVHDSEHVGAELWVGP